MTLPTSRAAYEDYYTILDRALEDPAGIRIKVESWETANFHRVRIHYARKLAKDESREIYAPGDPQYNVSPHDRLQCLIRGSIADDLWYLYIVPRTFGLMGEIESLNNTEYAPRWLTSEAPDFQPQLTLPTGKPLLITKLVSGSESPSGSNSSNNSTTPEETISEAPATSPSRRL